MTQCSPTSYKVKSGSDMMNMMQELVESAEALLIGNEYLASEVAETLKVTPQMAGRVMARLHDDWRRINVWCLITLGCRYPMHDGRLDLPVSYEFDGQRKEFRFKAIPAAYMRGHER